MYLIKYIAPYFEAIYVATKVTDMSVKYKAYNVYPVCKDNAPIEELRIFDRVDFTKIFTTVFECT